MSNNNLETVVPGAETAPELSSVESERKVRFDEKSTPSSGQGQFVPEEEAGGVMTKLEQAESAEELKLKSALKPAKILDHESDAPLAEVESWGGAPGSSEPSETPEPSDETKEKEKDTEEPTAILGALRIKNLSEEDLGKSKARVIEPLPESEDEASDEYDPAGLAVTHLGFEKPKESKKDGQKNVDNLTARNVISEKARLTVSDFKKSDFGKGLIRSTRYAPDNVDYSISKINVETNRRVPGEAIGESEVLVSATFGYGQIKYDDQPLIARVEVIGGTVPVLYKTLNDLYPPKDSVPVYNPYVSDGEFAESNAI